MHHAAGIMKGNALLDYHGFQESSTEESDNSTVMTFLHIPAGNMKGQTQQCVAENLMPSIYQRQSAQVQISQKITTKTQPRHLPL